MSSQHWNSIDSCRIALYRRAAATRVCQTLELPVPFIIQNSFNSRVLITKAIKVLNIVHTGLI